MPCLCELYSTENLALSCSVLLPSIVEVVIDDSAYLVSFLPFVEYKLGDIGADLAW